MPHTDKYYEAKVCLPDTHACLSKVPPPPALSLPPRGVPGLGLEGRQRARHQTVVLREQVVKSEKREGNAWYFLLHYSGWGKRYDEWVAQSGLVKYDADVVSA